MQQHQKSTFKINRNPVFNPKVYHNFALGLFAFLVAFLAAATLTPVKTSDAQELYYEVNSDTGFYVRVSGNATLSVDEVVGTTLGQLVSVKDTINVETNSPFGYRLLFSSATANLPNSANANVGFTPASGTIDTPSSLTRDTWGFAFDKNATGVVDNGFSDSSKYTSDSTPSIPDGSATWAAVPTTPTQLSSYDDANLNTNGTDLEIYYGINASTSLPTGTYATVITYTAYSEGVNEAIPYMQDFTQAQCDALTTDVPTKLMDSRDQKIYTVTKYKDGNCWMSSNLALDGSRTLTPSDSNVVTNHTLPANTEAEPQIDVPLIYSVGSTDYTKTCDTSYTSCVESTYQYGNLYNWYAATATTGLQATSSTIYESICPRGWRLPNSTGTKSYLELFSAYDYPTSYTENAPTYTTGTQKAPFNIPLAGNYSVDYYADGRYAAGIASMLYTRTPHSDPTGAVVLSIDLRTNAFAPSGRSRKQNGASVRCVYGEDSANLMQNFTAAQCNALTVSTASTPVKKILMDSRDGKLYNVSRLADNPSGTNNGICWMVSNLALDGADLSGTPRTLTPSDSNVTSNHTLAKNITDNTDDASYNEVRIYSTYANNYTKTCNAAYKYCVANDVPYGNYYNWFTATATTGQENTTTTVTESICPKNWRMPNRDGIGSYVNLATAYNLPTTYGTDSEHQAAIRTIQLSPLSFPLAGNSAGAHTLGRYSSYWSRTGGGREQTYAYYLATNAETGSFFIQNDTSKRSEFSVRCVLGN